MKPIEMMLRSHPRPDARHATLYAETLKALAMCNEICVACADACVAEAETETLRRCISSTLICSDICLATARALVRQTDAPGEMVHAQLHACVIACQTCAEECERHREMHDHCGICAETCRYCQERCNFAMGEISSAGTAGVNTGEDSPPLQR